MLLLYSLARAACPADSAAVSEEVAAATTAFASMDRPALADAVVRIQALTGCLGEPMTGPLAARIHTVIGYSAFVEGDSEAAARAFAAARAADAGWVLDRTLVPKGHPLATLAYQIDPATLERQELSTPSVGSLAFDGVTLPSRPMNAPAVAQWVVGDEVRSSGYLWPDSPMLPYDVDHGAERAGRAPLGWLGLAGTGLALSGASFYLASTAHADWERARTDADIIAAYQRDHLWFGAGATLGALGLVGGIGAVASLAW